MLAITPVFFGIANLDAAASAGVLEQFVPLCGAVLLTPLCLPEQNRDLRELVAAKPTPPALVCLLRVLPACLAAVLLIGGFGALMTACGSVFPFGAFWFGAAATALFLGGLGFCAAALSDNVAVGAMLSLGWYCVNLFSSREKLGAFYLFELSAQAQEGSGFDLSGKLVLMLLGVGLMAVGIVGRSDRRVKN